MQLSLKIIGIAVVWKNDKIELYHVDLENKTVKLIQTIKEQGICPLIAKFHLSRPLKLTVFSFCQEFDKEGKILIYVQNESLKPSERFDFKVSS